jgi:hypothetical protein
MRRDAVSLGRSSWAPSTLGDAGTTFSRNVGNANPATQRDVTQPQAVAVRVAPHFRAVASVYFYQPRIVFRQSPQTVT